MSDPFFVDDKPVDVTAPAGVVGGSAADAHDFYDDLLRDIVESDEEVREGGVSWWWMTFTFALVSVLVLYVLRRMWGSR